MKLFSIVLVTMLVITGCSVGNAEENNAILPDEQYDFSVTTTRMEARMVEENRFAMARVGNAMLREVSISMDEVKEFTVAPGDEYLKGAPMFIHSTSLLDGEMLMESINQLRKQQMILSSKLDLLGQIENDPVINRTQDIIYHIYQTSLFKDPLMKLDSEITRFDHSGMIQDVMVMDDAYVIKHFNNQFKEVTFTLNAEDSDFVKAGNKIESEDGRFTGYVTESTITELNGVKVVNVSGYIMDQYEVLSYGDIVSIKIIVEMSLKNVIPKAVVKTNNDLNYVYTVENNVIVKNLVKLDEGFDEYVSVIVGLRGTDDIVLAGANIVKEGNLVKINN